MRKGLIKLLEEVNGKFNDMYDGLDCEEAADFLINNGVTAPPSDESEDDERDCTNRPLKPPSPMSKLWAAKMKVDGMNPRLIHVSIGEDYTAELEGDKE